MLRCKNNPILKAGILILVVVVSLGLTSSAQAKIKMSSLGYRPGASGGGAWTGGNLGKTWAEGEWVPYQLVLEGIDPGLAGLDSIVISFDFSVPHAGDLFRFVDLARGIQVGTVRFNETQAWPQPDGSAFPLSTREEIEIGQNHPLENVWTGFTHLNLPSDQVNRTLSGDLDVPPGEERHILKIYKSDLLAAGIDINASTVVIYYQLHESRTFIWQNRLQATYDTPPTDVWGGYLYGTDSWDTLSVLGSGYVPGASGHVHLESPKGGKDIPIPIPPSPPGTISGLKWRDDNGNGAQDQGEPTLSGWQVHVSGTVEGVDLASSTHTDEFGNYSFPSLTAGMWTIKEDQQRDDPVENGYSQTYPTVGIQVGQGTGIAVGPPPPDAAGVGWEVELTLDIPDQIDMNFGNKVCDLSCDVIPDQDSVCVGSDASFTASGSGGAPPYTYDWTGPAGFTANTATITITNAQPANAGTYRVVVVDANDCVDTCYLQLAVYSPPVIDVVPQDDSVHAGEYFVSTDFSASGGNEPVTVSLCGITPTPTNQPSTVGSHVEWQTDCTDDGAYTICLEAADACGAADTVYFQVTVYNRDPELSCPGNGTVHAGEMFVSNDFSGADPDGDAVQVSFLDIAPSAANDPSVVGNHVEWSTTCAEDGDYVIRLVAADDCGALDTCQFTVTVYNGPPELICPEADTVYVGQTVISTDFSVTDPNGDVATVSFLDISPPATNDPTVVGNHVEWITTSNELGDYLVRLKATDPCGLADTCEFTVTVIREPPELVCPDDDTAHAGDIFVSTDFSYSYPVPIPVSLCGIDPSPTYLPAVVGNHVEWQTACDDVEKTFTICLEVTDEYGRKDTCYFDVTVLNRPPELVCPDDDVVHAGDLFLSTDFSVTDPDGGTPQVELLDINPPATNDPTIVSNHVEWRTTCSEDGAYTIRLEALNGCGARDTCEFTVTVYNNPPELTCPGNTSVNGGSGISTGDWSVYDPDGGTPTVDVLDITPPATHDPYIADSHVEWVTTCAEDGDYVIRLVATDDCGAKDTCEFTINVYNNPPELTCPGNTSVNAGSGISSGDWSVYDPDGGTPTVDVLDITPPATHDPYIVDSHVDWVTTCAEDGDYMIRLVATDRCGAKDTCEFTINVYNDPPELTCPAGGSVHATSTALTGDFSVYDSDGHTPTVDILDISPPATHSPTIVDGHVEWPTTCNEDGDYDIRLVAVDRCGLADTCQFTINVYNDPPEITCPSDDSVLAGESHLSTNFGVYDPDFDLTWVDFLAIAPPATSNPVVVGDHVEWQTSCNEDGDYVISLVARDDCGAKDTCEFTVTVYNHPPEVVCPDNGSVKAGETFFSTPFWPMDPDGQAPTVNFLDINPPATHNPTIAGDWVEWVTTCAEDGDYTIRLVGTDHCGLADTCGFVVTVYNPPPELTCPEDDGVHAGDHFVSADFSYTDPGLTISPVSVCGIDPPAAHTPYVVSSHVEWQTECSDAGKVFTICLVGTDNCGAKDTCYFDVTVYNRPPELTCPEDDIIYAGDWFTSTDFSVTDPDGDTPQVNVLDIIPPATNNPYITERHVEWLTTCSDTGLHTIRLVASDDCGVKDTCEFTVTVYNNPPQLTCPDSGNVHAGQDFYSGDFSVSNEDPQQVQVNVLDITPPATHSPYVADQHVEWTTTCNDAGLHAIRLEAIDHCGLADTCEFKVYVYNDPPELTCPEGDTVEAGDSFVSADFSATDPDDGAPQVDVLDITPPATSDPTIVGSHVEWLTTSNEDGDYTIRLVATDPCELADTCELTVTVIPPPEDFICPDDDSVHAGEVFVSTDFYYSAPSGPKISVDLCGVDPAPVHMPVIVADHVEWQTECEDAGKTFTICLEATDDYGRKDTCYFDVKVYNRPPELTCPEDDSISAGDLFTSTDYSVTDPDDPSGVQVRLHSVTPTPTNAASLVAKHVEWTCSCQDLDIGPDFTFTLIATDPCGAEDTCEFTVTVYNLPPELVCPEDDSVHAGDYFTSGDVSVPDPKAQPLEIQLCGVTPDPTNPLTLVESHVELQTECADAGKIFTICLETTDDCGFKDTCYFDLTVYNRSPELTCPEDGIVSAGNVFLSSDFSVVDPDGDSVVVTFLDISPPATNDPSLVDSHVEWVTTVAERGDYIIRLVATDSCGLADTCEFLVIVDEPTGDFICPDDDSVHAGDLFVSTNFTITYPECDPSSVQVLGITPAATYLPTIVAYHVEWQTTCSEDRDYVITLITGEGCSVPDTCSFTVTVYNRPPELTCPDYGTVAPTQLFISTDFYTNDPDGDDVSVYLLGIDPPAEYDPVIVERHVEWQTACVEGDYIITLVATDLCGLADTCEFMVTVTWDPVPDFYVWVYPITAYVSPGESVGYLVELNAMNGYHKPCSLYVSGLPLPPDSAAFDQVVITPTSYTTMTVYTLPQTDTGTYTLTVTGKEIGGPVAHSTQVYLKVLDAQLLLDVDDEVDESSLPKTFTLFQNQPNPFNPETRIAYYLPRDCHVRVIIYNILGQAVKTLFEGHQGAGLQTLIWNGRDDAGVELSSGVYLYRLQADDFIETRKMMLIK